MKKRLICLLLVLAMAFAVLAGCAGSPAQEPAPAEESVPAEESAPAEEAAPSEEAAPAEGEAAPEEAPVEEAPPEPETLSYPLCEELTTLTYWQAWPPFLSTFCSPEENETFAKLEEITNVHLDITVVDTETQSEKFNLMVAADDMTDIMQGAVRVYTGGGTKAIEDEVILDLWDYANEYMPDFAKRVNADENIRRKMLDDQGQMAQIYGLYDREFYMDQGFWIRQDFLDKVGLDTPNTLDELEAVLEAFKTELNLPQPLVLLAQTPQIGFLGNAFETGVQNIDGKLVDNSLSDNMKDYYKKMHEWYEKSYFSQDFLDNTYSMTKPPEELVYQDKGGMYNEDVTSISTYRKNHSNPDFELRALPQVLLTEDQVLDTCPIPSFVSEKYAMSLSTNCEEEEIPLALGVLNYMFTEDGRILGNFGIEGTTYFVQDNGEPMFTDFILNHQLGYQGAQSAYINPGIPCLVDLAVSELTYDDAQKEAVEIWIKNYSSSDKTVPSFSLNTEESTESATIQTDINTYIEEMNLKFIMGEADIDATWDEYVQTIKELGYDKVRELNQTAFDRYLAK